jgi:hypothetical protein
MKNIIIQIITDICANIECLFNKIITQLHFNSEFFQYFYSVYFSQFPFLLYKEASNQGNMAYLGVGLGLINCRNLFWFLNINTCILTCILIYFFRNYKEHYLNFKEFFMLYICFYSFMLYIIFQRTNYLISFIKAYL